MFKVREMLLRGYTPKSNGCRDSSFETQLQRLAMYRNVLTSLTIVAAATTIWAACADSGFAFGHGHHRYPHGSSPIYLNATPHGGFSSSNGYYSGRSRIVDAPAAPVQPIIVKPAPAK
jgi:hypothetical protein